MTKSIESITCILRVIGTSTNDKLISEFVSKYLEETKEEMLEDLSQTCWGSDKPNNVTYLGKNIRNILKEDYNLKSN